MIQNLQCTSWSFTAPQSAQSVLVSVKPQTCMIIGITPSYLIVSMLLSHPIARFQCEKTTYPLGTSLEKRTPFPYWVGQTVRWGHPWVAVSLGNSLLWRAPGNGERMFWKVCLALQIEDSIIWLLPTPYIKTWMPRSKILPTHPWRGLV